MYQCYLLCTNDSFRTLMFTTFLLSISAVSKNVVQLFLQHFCFCKQIRRISPSDTFFVNIDLPLHL